MKIGYISDLHIDFYVKEHNPQSPKFKKQIKEFVQMIVQEVQSEILVIAGDLSHNNNLSKYILLELKNYFKEIMVVFGNHDLYLVSSNIRDKYNSNSFLRLHELREICSEIDIHYLDGNTVKLNGIVFGGSGHWYNLQTDEDIKFWESYMNDGNLILNGPRVRIGWNMYSNESVPSFKPKEFYESELKKLFKCLENKNIDVYVTHMGLHEPTKSEGMKDRYVGDPANIFYYTEHLKELKESNVQFHIHGHTHEQLDYVSKEGIRVLCNPLGYPSENTYSTIKYFEI